MPEQKVVREAVLDAALSLVRERGESALSARAIAERAGCSVQPIYSLFGDMKSLLKALYDHARAWVAAYNREHEHRASNVFEANGFSHLRLARTEGNLFRFLYLSAHMDAASFEDVYRSVALPNVERCVVESSGLRPSAAHALYLHMIVYTHGMATMLASGARFTDEELHARMDEAFRSFLALAEHGDGSGAAVDGKERAV